MGSYITIGVTSANGLMDMNIEITAMIEEVQIGSNLQQEVTERDRNLKEINK